MRLAFLEAVLGSAQATVAGDTERVIIASPAPRVWQPPADLARVLGYFAFDRIGVVVEAALRISSGTDSPTLCERPSIDPTEHDPGTIAPEQTRLAPLKAADYGRALQILPPAPTELVIALQRISRRASTAAASRAAA